MRGEIANTYPVSSSANGSAEWPPDDRLRRTIQYSRDRSERIEQPRRTGSPAFAGDDSLVWSRTIHVFASEAKQSILPFRGEMDCFVASAPRNDGGRPHPSHSTQDSVPV